jgi:iron complex outermembrane receptor protein
VSELDYYQELPVVLSASRLAQPLSEAPNAMTVIDRKMIIASGSRTIPDLFKLVPGMYVSYYKGSQAFVSYHGTTDQYARRMQVMIDGRSVYMPPVSTVDWADLPITVDDIERIEVIRGPAAASHGANSTQGVISIITRDAGVLDGGSVAFTRGGKGINDVTARFGRRGERFNHRMTLAYSADDGYDNLLSAPPGKSITQPQVPSLLNNSFDNNRSKLLNYHADFLPNNVDNFEFQFGLNHDVQTVGWTDKNTGTNFNTTHELFSDASFIQLGWVHQLAGDSELQLRYYHIHHNKWERLPYYIGGSFNAGPITQSLTTGRDEIEAQHTLHTAPNNRLVYGAAWRKDDIDGNATYDNLLPAYSFATARNEYRIFAHDEWRITQSLLLNTGGMYEKDGMGNTNTSPRIALNLHLSPRRTLRVGTSIAYRTPALVEAQFPSVQPGELFIPGPTVNSPGLRPERMQSQEIGYLEHMDATSSLDLRVFSEQLSDGIYWNAANMFVNGMHTQRDGVEITFKHALNNDSHLTLNLAHQAGNSNAPALLAAGNTSLQPASSSIIDSYSGSIPRSSASALYSQDMGDGFSYSAAYYFQDALQPFDRGSADYQPVQRRMDVRLAQAFHPWGGIKGEVALVIQNLFDQRYTEYVANNVFDRHGHLTLRFNW